MNTKFDVGQRVTYPVVHTADGNITGIAVSKAGVARYAIGPKWYTEDDLKLPAEENSDAGITATVPPAESKPEPVKLYCFKGFRNLLTLGKIYTVPEDGKLIFDNGDKSFYDWKSKIPSTWPENLCALVRRPAKVGEWIYIVDADPAFCGWYNGNYKNGDVMRITALPPVDRRGSGVMSGTNYMVHSGYLVLDGYHGAPA